MPKYLSGRSKKNPDDQLSADRYKYLSLGDAESNPGDPQSSGITESQKGSVIGGFEPPTGSTAYTLVTYYDDDRGLGTRYWEPVGGGIIPGSSTVQDEGKLVGTAASITTFNFVGSALTAVASPYVVGGTSGFIATMTVSPPGEVGSVLFKENIDYQYWNGLSWITAQRDDFNTSPNLVFNSSVGILTVGQGINIGTAIAGVGGSIFNVTGVGNSTIVGVGTTTPLYNLHVIGDIGISSGTIYDVNNFGGNDGDIILKNSDGYIEWKPRTSVVTSAGGTIGNIQFHDSGGYVDGASDWNGSLQNASNSFVWDFTNHRVGLGSTQPSSKFDVIGDSKFVGFTTTTDLEAQQLKVSGISTFVGFSTFNDNVYIAGITTIGDIKIEENTISTDSGNLILESGGTIVKINDKLKVDNDTESTYVDDGALQVDGGAGINKNLNVGGAVSFTGPSVGVAVTLAAAGGITTTGGDLYIGGNIFVNDDIVLDEARVQNLIVNAGVATFHGNVHALSKVGIGTTNPINTLHLHGDTSGVGPVLQMSNDTGDCRLFFGTNSTTDDANAQGQIRYNVADNHLTLYTTGTEKLRITSNGTANIGTTNSVLTQTTYKAQIETETNKTISFGNAEHNDLNHEASGIFFSRQNDGSAQLSGIFAHSNSSLGIAARKDITFHTGGTSDYTATTEALRIQSDGDVGIGTIDNSNNERLRVQDDATTTTSCQLSIISGNAERSILNFGDKEDANIGRITYDNNDNHLSLWTNDTEKLRITGIGSVGIGITDPYYKLHVNFNNSDTALSGGSNGNWGGAGLRLENENTTVGSMSLIHFRTGNHADWHVGGKFVGSNNSDLVFLQEGVNEKLRITNAGNVDINGTPPWTVTTGDYRSLSISGQVANSGGFIWLGNGAATTNADHDLGRINFLNGATITSQIAGSTQTSANDDGRLTFHTQATGGSLTEKLRITSTGLVGIGTNNPDELLHIAGVGTSRFRITDERLSIGDGEQYGVIQFEQRDANTPGVSVEMAAVMTDTSNGATALQFKTGTPSTITERLRIDSSGRLIVGGGTDTSETTITAKGNTTSSTSFSVLDLRRGEAADAVDDVLGYIRFSDTDITSDNQNYAHIHAAVDGESTNLSDNPGRLVFSTTADGDPGPTERLRITSGGNVGIGITNPTGDNCVEGVNNVLAVGVVTANTLYGTVIGGITATGDITIPDFINHKDNTDTKFGFPEDDTFTVETDGTERLRITGIGSVGIGTTNPDKPLEVYLSNTNTYSSLASNTPDLNTLLTLTNKSGTDGTGSGYYTAMRFAIASGATSSGWLAFHRTGDNKGDFTFKARNTADDYPELMRIKSTGVVNIGDSTASSASDRLLQIGNTNRSATYIEVRTSTAGVGGVVFSDGTADDSTAYRGTIEYDHGATNTDEMFFKTAAEERLRITSEGYLKLAGTISGSDNKLGRFLMPSHDSNEEDVMYMQFQQEDTFNQLEFGGGSSDYNAATRIIFRTAAVDTLTGTERLRITPEGYLKKIQDPTNRTTLPVGTGQTYSSEGLYFDHYQYQSGSSYQRYADIVSVGSGAEGSNIRFLTMPGDGTAVERLRINSDGIVTIKGPTNSHALELKTADNTSSLVVSRNGNITSNIRASDGNSNIGDVNNAGGSRLRLGKNQIHFDTYPAAATLGYDPVFTERLTIDSSGVVRVGNTATQTTSSDTKRIALGERGSIWGWVSGQIDGSLNLADNYYWDGDNNKAIVSADAAYLALRNGTLRFGTTDTTPTAGGTTALTEKFRITGIGSVGIGTTGPDEILHIGQVGTVSNDYNEGRLKIGGFQGTDKGLLIGYDNRGSGRTNIVNANNSGGDNNRINIGFGAITASGAPTTEVITINQSGDVGIGTNNPTGADALSDNNTVLAVGVVTANTLYGTVIGGVTVPTGDITIPEFIKHKDDTDTKFGFPSDNTFVVNTSNSRRLTINGGFHAQSGISTFTSSSSDTYSASQTASITTQLRVYNTDDTANDTYAGLTLASTNTNSQQAVFNIACVSQSDDRKGNLIIQTRLPDDTYVERLRIDSDGKLLLGITASTSTNAQIQSFKPTGNDSTIVIGNVATNASGLSRLDFAPSNSTIGARIECHATEDFSEVAKRTADLVFVTRKDGTNSEKLRITSEGELQAQRDYDTVGINTFAKFNRAGGGGPELEIGYNALTTDYGYFGTGSSHPLALRVNDHSALYINTNEKVGINTDTPGSRLAIYDGSGHNIYLRNSWSGESGIGFGGGDSSDGNTDTDTAGRISVTASAPDGNATGYMSFKTNSGDDLEERLRITSEGKVQIDRTVSATSGNHPALEVETLSSGSEDSTFATGIDFNVDGVHKKRLAVTNGTGEGGGDWIFYKDNGTNEALRITSTGQLEATGAADVRLTLGSSGTAETNDSVHIRADNADLKFMSASGGTTIFETNGTETLRITSDGDVGIGTNNPTGVNAIGTGNTAVLAVGVVTANTIYGSVIGDITTDGDVTIEGELTLSTNKAIHFKGTNANNYDAILHEDTSTALLINSRNDTIVNIDSNNNTANANAHFAVAYGAATNSSTELFRIQEDGNVGIGTNNPTGAAALTDNETVLAVGLVTTKTVYANTVYATTIDGTNINVNGSTLTSVIEGTTVTNSSHSTTSSYADNAGIATNIKGGDSNKIPYQTASSDTDFIDAPTGSSYLGYDNTSSSFVWSTPQGTGIADVEVKQYKQGTTERTCSNPISVTSNNIIGIGSTSNAYGNKYIQTAEPTGVCDGDIWYDPSDGGGTSNLANLSEIDLWTITADSSTGLKWEGTDDILGGGSFGVNIARCTTTQNPLFTKQGLGMSYSSGVFTFPNTGTWEVSANLSFSHTVSPGSGDISRRMQLFMQLTTNNSSYSKITSSNAWTDWNDPHTVILGPVQLTITDTSLQKIRFTAYSDYNMVFNGATDMIESSFSFKKLA